MTHKSIEQDYVDIFEARGDLYNEAASIAPNARLVERQILIDLLAIEPHHVVCDAPAGGGFLADAIGNLVSDRQQVVCIEPSRKFAKMIDAAFTKHISPLHAMPLEDGTIDRVGSLAGLHHIQDKTKFFYEAHRVLKPGGQLCVGDVVDQTPVADFLNGPVDLYTTTGHQGVFLQERECASLLRSTGFTQVSEEHRKFHWEFRSIEQLVKYCKILFGMVKATEQQVHDEITRFFVLEHTAEAVKLPWSLVYGVGVKER